MQEPIQNDYLDKIDKAIANLRRGKQKLSITSISQKSGVARRTIYNREELRTRCEQAIMVQEEGKKASEEVAATNVDEVPATLYGRKLLEQRYSKAKDKIQEQEIALAKVLENNRKLVIEKDEMKGTIQRLQSEVSTLREQLRKERGGKISPIN